jgi:23S rRNA (adenine2030-N6)-methyltransferase
MGDVVAVSRPTVYQHSRHAGNHGDVFKHFVLSRLIVLAGRTGRPVSYLDTHAGSGRYDLVGEGEAAIGEWRDGIGRLYRARDLPPALVDYVSCVQRLNGDGALRHYPGSPEVAGQLCGPLDRLRLCENESVAGQLLRDNYRGDSRVSVELADGWPLAARLTSAADRAILLLIDPPYRDPADLERAANAMRLALESAPTAIVAIWYPLQHGSDPGDFLQTLRSMEAPHLLRAELHVQAMTPGPGLSGSGVAIANAPQGFVAELSDTLPWLASRLDQGAPRWDLEVLK